MTIFNRNTLWTLALALLLVPALIFAQDTAEDELPECPDFEGQSTDVRIGYYMGEAIAFTQAGQRGSAEFSYSCIIEVIDPNYLPAYIGRADIYTSNRDYERAIEDLTRILELDPTSAVAYNNRGIIYTLQQEYELAAADYESAVSIDSGFVPSLNNRALIHLINDEYDSALAIFEQIIASSNVDAALEIIRDPENEDELPEFEQAEAQAYAMIGLIRSAQAIDNYDNYLTAVGGRADGRIQSAAGELESRFTFDLRIDDGSFFLRASFATDEDE